MWGIIGIYMKANFCPSSYFFYNLVGDAILKRSSFPKGHINDPSCPDLSSVQHGI